MLIPVYEDEVNEFEECTYDLMTYEVDGECIFLFNEKESIERQIEEVTHRPIDELVSSQMICVLIKGQYFSLEDVLQEGIKEFIGEEITIECC